MFDVELTVGQMLTLITLVAVLQFFKR